MPKFSVASLEKLKTCHPELQAIAHEVITCIDFTVVEGHRGQAAQDRAFAEGKSQVRWPNGKHNALPSLALDVAPVYYDAGMKIDWNDLVAFGRLMGAFQMAAARHGVRLRFGLDWDGDFRTVNRDPSESFMDAPHVEFAGYV